MQGVRLVRTPPANTSGMARAGLPESVSRSVEKSTIGRVRDERHAMVVNGQSRVNGALADASSKSGLDGRARLPRFIGLEKSMSRSALGTWLPTFFGMVMAGAWFPASTFCQVHDPQ